MPTNIKLLQSGVNVQANDLALSPGTPLQSVNFDHQRDGVAMSRHGFDRFDNGLPWVPIDPSYSPSLSGTRQANTRGVFELFSRNRSMQVHGGCIFDYDETLKQWMSVPVDLPHRWTFFGDGHNLLFNASGEVFESGLGRALIHGGAIGIVSSTPFRWQGEVVPSNPGAGAAMIYGDVGNDAADASLASGSLTAKFYQPADYVNNRVPDFNTIRDETGALIAGSLTVMGHADGTGAAATFNGASWACPTLDSPGVNTGAILVADNSNMIRRVTSAGVVTTFAGSITAGDVDGVGTAALFRGISGLAFDGTQFAYATESGGDRVRKIDVFTGSVTIFAGALTPTPGFVNGTGTAARFHAPTGCEIVGTNLYVGDTTNNVIRAITLPGAVVTTYAGSATPEVNGLVGGSAQNGAVASCILPSVVLRGKYTPSQTQGADGYLIIECTSASNSSLDVGLVFVSPNSVLDAAKNVYHIARCPNAYPNAADGPIKLDTIGPMAYSSLPVRGVDAAAGVIFNTSERPRAIDVWNKFGTDYAQPRLRSLGILQPEAPSVTYTTGSTFAANSTWAYRIVNGLSLPDGRIALGPPSERIVVVGSATAACAGSLTTYASPGLPYDGMPFMQIYRTKTFDASLDPGDQTFLCYETTIAYGQGVQFVDQLPDELLGSELYTNSTQDGIAFASLPPPTFCRDVTSFAQSLVLSNFVSPATLTIKVLGTSGLSAGSSTVTLSTNKLGISHNADTVTFTAIAGATNPKQNNFQIASGGTAAQNAVQTARNLVACINRSPDAMWFTAQYDEGNPGNVIVTNLYPGLSPTQTCTSIDFTDVSRTTNVQAEITFSTNASSNFITVEADYSQRKVNSVQRSDQNAFDSFPIVQAFTVGPATETILRTLPTAESLLFVKDDSVWRCDQAYAPQIYDLALACTLPDSFARLNNQWIGLFTRGFVALTTVQAVAVGRQIDRDVTSQYGFFFDDNIADAAYAAAIDVFGNYLCSFNNVCYCYNTIEQSWNYWQINSLSPRDNGISDNVVSCLSEMGVVGAYRDAFIVANDDVRSVYLQRDHRREPLSSTWYKDFADAKYLFTGVLGADLKTITIAQYDPTSNPGSLPPYNWTAPDGSVSNDAVAQVTFDWVFEITQSDRLATVPGIVVPLYAASATSPVTLTTSEALIGGFIAGTVTVSAYAPIICRTLYAPVASPGDNSMFTDILVTLERTQPGWLLGLFYGRQDQGNAEFIAVGAYDSNMGVARAVQMPSLTTNDYGINDRLTYENVQRFTVPSERATGQTLGVELWAGCAWQPFAIKSVAIKTRTNDNAKVTQ